jgi:hypothetical protein
MEGYMITRDKGYNDYKITKDQVRFILDYCISIDADHDMIRHCCELVDSSVISDFLFNSLIFRKSYERLGYVPLGKNDFYGKKRKVIWELKKEMFRVDE